MTVSLYSEAISISARTSFPIWDLGLDKPPEKDKGGEAIALAALEVAAVGDPSSQWMARGWKVHGKGNGSEIQESKSIRAG